MAKWLLVVLVVGGVLWALGARRRGLRDGSARRSRPPASKAPPAAMVTCAHCGLHLPAADAVVKASRSYCCEAHRDRGPVEDAR